MSAWYALRVVTRRERVVAAGLGERGFPAFLPMQADWAGQPRERRLEPLLPGYVFVLCDPEDFAELIGLEEVINFVRYIRNDGIAWPIEFPGSEILGLQIEERAGTYDFTRLVKPPRYRPKKGETVRITAGTYYGFIAKVLSAPREDRCKLMIEGLGKPRRRTEDVAHLEAA
jgi:transcription antitermination factor NusG